MLVKAYAVSHEKRLSWFNVFKKQISQTAVYVNEDYMTILCTNCWSYLKAPEFLEAPVRFLLFVDVVMRSSVNVRGLFTSIPSHSPTHVTWYNSHSRLRTTPCQFTLL